jgi:hypothetical protein
VKGPIKQSVNPASTNYCRVAQKTRDNIFNRLSKENLLIYTQILQNENVVCIMPKSLQQRGRGVGITTHLLTVFVERCATKQGDLRLQIVFNIQRQLFVDVSHE